MQQPLNKDAFWHWKHRWAPYLIFPLWLWVSAWCIAILLTQVWLPDSLLALVSTVKTSWLFVSLVGVPFLLSLVILFWLGGI